MTAQGEDILAWLDRAIRERESAAKRLVGLGACPDWGHCQADCNHENNDARVQADVAERLRRCSADRALLELHGGRCHSCPAKDESGYLDEWTQFDYGDQCPVVKALADAYGWADEPKASARIAAFREVRDRLKTEALRTDSEPRYQTLAWVVRLLDEMAAEQTPPIEGDPVT